MYYEQMQPSKKGTVLMVHRVLICMLKTAMAHIFNYFS